MSHDSLSCGCTVNTPVKIGEGGVGFMKAGPGGVLVALDRLKERSGVAAAHYR